jgi:hypothetical protein
MPSGNSASRLPGLIGAVNESPLSSARTITPDQIAGMNPALDSGSRGSGLGRGFPSHTFA